MTARRLHNSQLETATARRRLALRKKPYWFTISPGIALGYRRNQGAGTWSVRVTDGHGADWIKRLALADDHEDADGTHILTYWQAQTRARAVARGGNRPFDDARQRFLAFIEQGIEPACYLYRHFHPNGDLLYVGISLAAMRRQGTHFNRAVWHHEIHQIVIEPFATREEALAAEEFAIRTEFPKFNSRQNTRRHPLQEISRITGSAS